MEFQFASLADFLAMNGHGPFVWVAYGVTLATMAGLLLQPVLRKRQLQREFLREQRIRARRADSRQIAAPVMETAAAE
ncbi:heme exporter protein CcmD [Microbulbifer yueqingensis]|uniref:Heme exporter protein D n=1 Tax=Microbulbifer yueqingensis TaxID=658219 RepID=A0A1G9AL27_9GAMM|nr:heme exporter protein CcmD [Microbulbifer yueqingensis]SDK28076.1 heme exporter protein D [Microbulbifer yueqingensis]